jgi:hypothetical protein
MSRVTWSAQAVADLQTVVATPAVRDQLRHNAESILRDIPPIDRPADEGEVDGIMWHRGATHEDENSSGQADSPQSYFLFYRRQEVGPGYEVLAVRSVQQIASAYLQMNEETAEATDAPPRR